MDAYEFTAHISRDGNLKLPESVTQRLPKGGVVRVLILVESESVDPGYSVDPGFFEPRQITSDQLIPWANSTDLPYDGI